MDFDKNFWSETKIKNMAKFDKTINSRIKGLYEKQLT